MLRSGSCFLWVACLILAVAAMVEPLLAQTNTGTITGQILDPSKAVVPAARVSVTNLSTNVSKTVVSTSEGLYTAPSLEPGPYRVTVEKEGFETTLVEVVQVFTGNTTTANVTLKIGKAAQAVTVSAQATLLSPNTSTQGGTLENRLLTDLPVAERSVLGAITLLPGVQGDPSAGTSEVQSENPNPFTGPITPGGEISIGGGRPGQLRSW